jgi:glycosyltransferase involved in cell wall biosynthesis
MDTPRLQISVGVFASNEQDSIVDCLRSIRRSRCESIVLDELFVVSSGSTDATDERAAAAIADVPGWRLLTQPTREGKASAVNLFLRQARNPVCVLANADTLLHEGALEALCRPLLRDEVGMAGGHPIPIPSRRGRLDFAIQVFWELHHELCLRAPKMGELVAFRRVFDQLPLDEAGADEDWIHSEIERLGLRAAYAPDAILFNRGPGRLRDFLAHRRRMALQHLVLARRRSFQPASRETAPMRQAITAWARANPKRLPQLIAAACLEGTARAWAHAEFALLGTTQTNWRRLASSKGLTQADVDRERGE